MKGKKEKKWRPARFVQLAASNHGLFGLTQEGRVYFLDSNVDDPTEPEDWVEIPAPLEVSGGQNQER